MSGSNTWREYESDSGQKYSISIDKSNASANFPWTGEKATKSRTSNLPLMPKGLTPRFLHCWNQSNPKQKKSFIIGNRNAINGSQLAVGQIYLTTENPAVVWIVTGYIGEKYSCPTYYSQLDTGLTDGTPY